MGACCSGKESKKTENQEEEIYTKPSRLNSYGENIYNQIKPSFDLEIENSSMSKNLTCIIKKIVNEDIYRDEIKLTKLSLEYLWNIYRFYLEDHSESNYILYDYRENSLREQNFLKKFKAINYKIEQMKNFTNTQFQKFRKYIKEKNIIIISKEDSIITIEEFIYFVLENKINSRIYLFDYNLTAKNNLSELNKNFLDVLDYPNFNSIPFIFLSLRFFPHMKSESLIFLDFVNYEGITNNDENEYYNCIKTNRSNYINNNILLAKNKKYNEDDFFESKLLAFFKLFKISLNLKLNTSKDSALPHAINNNNKNNLGFNTNTSISDKRNYNIVNKCIREIGKNNNTNSINSENKQGIPNQYNYHVKVFELNEINHLENLTTKKEFLIDFIDIVKKEIQTNKSVIIQVPTEIDKDVLVAFLLLFVWKITDVDPINLTSYLKETLFYIRNLNNFSEEKFEKILKFLEDDFGLPNKIDNNIFIRSSNSFYQTLKSKTLKSNNFDTNKNSLNENENMNNFMSMGINGKFGFEGIRKRLNHLSSSSGFGKGYYFNKENYEEKSKEEKEKIRQEMVVLNERVIFK